MGARTGQTEGKKDGVWSRNDRIVDRRESAAGVAEPRTGYPQVRKEMAKKVKRLVERKF